MVEIDFKKIKAIKRKAHGYHDLRYFKLKVYQAF